MNVDCSLAVITVLSLNVWFIVFSPLTWSHLTRLFQEVFLDEGVRTLSVDLAWLRVGLDQEHLQIESILENFGLNESLNLDAVSLGIRLFVLFGLQVARH